MTTDNNEPQLKPCPFCGATPIRRDNVYRYGSIAEHPEGTHCPIENTTIGVKSWNSRVCVDGAAPTVKHHKLCSVWTVTTSGDANPCNCVCECTHSVGEHIRRGQDSWFEECAHSGCECAKFVATATTAAPAEQSDAAEWHVCSKCGNKRQVAAATFLCRYCFGTDSSPAAAAPVEQDDGWVTFGRVKVDLENETETFERIHPPVAATGDDEGENDARKWYRK